MSEFGVRLEGGKLVADLRLHTGESLGHRQQDAAGFERYLDLQLRSLRKAVLGALDALTAEGEVGTVKFFDRDKGWGFITVSSVDEVFVRWSGIKGEGHRELASGERVRFRRIEGRNHGYEAIDVERLASREGE